MSSIYVNELCLNKFQAILIPGAYDLIGSFSMTTYGLVFLSNEILLNGRSNILEFGCGLSTVYMALTIRKHNLNARITSIESDRNWVERLNVKLSELNLIDIVTVIYAPLVDDIEMAEDNQWYDDVEINRSIDKELRFDMVLVDGPPAFNPDISLSRHGALPCIINRLAENYAIFIDDANRLGERRVIKLWNDKFDLQFKTYDNRIAVCRKGPFINSFPGFLSKRTGE